VRDRERGRGRERNCVCVCVRVSEREREREGGKDFEACSHKGKERGEGKNDEEREKKCV